MDVILYWPNCNEVYCKSDDFEAVWNDATSFTGGRYADKFARMEVVDGPYRAVINVEKSKCSRFEPDEHKDMDKYIFTGICSDCKHGRVIEDDVTLHLDLECEYRHIDTEKDIDWCEVCGWRCERV